MKQLQRICFGEKRPKRMNPEDYVLETTTDCFGCSEAICIAGDTCPQVTQYYESRYAQQRRLKESFGSGKAYKPIEVEAKKAVKELERPRCGTCRNWNNLYRNEGRCQAGIRFTWRECREYEWCGKHKPKE